MNCVEYGMLASTAVSIIIVCVIIMIRRSIPLPERSMHEMKLDRLVKKLNESQASCRYNILNPQSDEEECICEFDKTYPICGGPYTGTQKLGLWERWL